MCRFAIFFSGSRSQKHCERSGAPQRHPPRARSGDSCPDMLTDSELKNFGEAHRQEYLGRLFRGVPFRRD